jgi:hypothetical protein
MGLVVAGGIAVAVVLARQAEVAARAPAMAGLWVVSGTAVAALTAVC